MHLLCFLLVKFLAERAISYSALRAARQETAVPRKRRLLRVHGLIQKVAKTTR
jgi:hypothetical protein